MKISYNWLKSYISEVPEAQKLADILTYHLAEVESVKAHNDDFILEIKILPNRAHDLLSHQGIAREISSLLNIEFVDHTEKYDIPPSGPTNLSLKIESDKCRRYMSRIIRGVKVGPSPEWIVMHLESIGQRSINNMVDAANMVMFDCGQPTHIFDLKKIKDGIVIRQAKAGENMTTLDNKVCVFTENDLVVADNKQVLAIAGVKGGKVAEVDIQTTDIVLEVANFDSVSVRKTAQRLNIFTDAKKRFENDLSPELAEYAMSKLSAIIFEMCPDAKFENIVDEYPVKQKEKKLSFRTKKINSILGVDISTIDIGNILKRYKIGYKNDGDMFEIVIPPLRLDLNIEEDMAEEVGRIMGYDKVNGVLSKVNFKTKINETYLKISWARNKLLSEGYSEVITYAFADKGEVVVLESASDKKFMRTNLSDGLKESIKLNQANLPLLGLSEIKVFEIGTVFKKDLEEIHVTYGNKKEVKEMSLEEFCKMASPDDFVQSLGSSLRSATPSQNHPGSAFAMWSLFPFITRDVAVWVPEGVESEQVYKVIKENAGDLVVRGPDLFDSFSKEGKVSYAFRLVFQSYDRTLTDAEINTVMENINKKILENDGWQVR